MTTGAQEHRAFRIEQHGLPSPLLKCAGSRFVQKGRRHSTQAELVEAYGLSARQDSRFGEAKETNGGGHVLCARRRIRLVNRVSESSPSGRSMIAGEFAEFAGPSPHAAIVKHRRRNDVLHRAADVEMRGLDQIAGQLLNRCGINVLRKRRAPAEQICLKCWIRFTGVVDGSRKHESPCFAGRQLWENIACQERQTSNKGVEDGQTVFEQRLLAAALLA